MWHINLFMKFDQLFETEDISSTLKIVSLKTLETPLGIQDLSQTSFSHNSMNTCTIPTVLRYV